MTLSLDRVSVARGGRTVLDGVSVTFTAGRMTAVVGPNGAGKSTMLMVAAGLLAPACGTVTLDGTPLSQVGRRGLAQRRAYLPQSPRADWPISVERVVALGLTPSLPPFGGLPPELSTRVDEALARHDLLDLRARPATELSGGELARAMLARATVADPALLLVDEPTAGLDPRHALDAARRLRTRADQGRTVVMAIHDLDLALRFADEVVALKDGRLVAAGATTAVFTEELLGRLYDVRAHVSHDAHGGAIRFFERQEPPCVS